MDISRRDSLFQFQYAKPLLNEIPIIGNKGKFNKAAVASSGGLVRIVSDNPQDQFESAEVKIDQFLEPSEISIVKMLNMINVNANRI